MTGLVDTLRGTLAGVLGASAHLAWYVEWQTGGRRCARETSRRAPGAVLERRAA